MCTHNDHFSANTDNFTHHYLTKFEQNIFTNIFTDKFKERVTLVKSNSGIV